MLFERDTFAILGACFEVYRELGRGFLEPVYQECLSIEFSERGIPYVEKPRLVVMYKGHELRRVYEPDFVCFDRIALELKAVRGVVDEHRAQVLNYLRAGGLRLGLLVNFGHYPLLEHERLLN